MSSDPDRRHTTVHAGEEHEHARSSQAQEQEGKREQREEPPQVEEAGGREAAPGTEAGSKNAPSAVQAGDGARGAWKEQRQSSEQQAAAAGTSKQQQQQSGGASKRGSAGPPASEGGSGSGSQLQPPPSGRPPLPPAELLRAQLAFASGPGPDGARGGPPTPYPSLEALAAAGSAVEGVGTSGGGEQGVDTEEGDAVSHRRRRGSGYDAAEELSETEGEGGSGDSRRDHGGRSHKKPRLVWTAELHARFMNAVTHLGVKHAVPKTILQLMNVEGMTRENVASHLQKYRLYLKRLAGYPSAAKLPLDTLQQVQQAIQQQGHPPLFQHNMSGLPPGVAFPGFMPPPPPGAAAGGPQLQWGPPPGEGTSASAETSAPLPGNPWLSLQQGGFGGAMMFPPMGSFGQPPGSFPGQEVPPGLPYGWVWGLASPGSGAMAPPPDPSAPQLPHGEHTPSAAPSDPGPSGEQHVRPPSRAVAVGGSTARSRPTAAEGGPTAGGPPAGTG